MPPQSQSGPEPAAQTPEQAIALLQQGNERFLKGTAAQESLTRRRLELTAGQSPFAAILGCSDSRVPLETLFDQEPGDLFVIRVAGNFVTDHGLGSIEFAVAVLGTPLVVVLGHSGCGAVGATIEYVANHTTQPGHIMDLVHHVEPAVRQTQKTPGNWLHNAIIQNVFNNVAALKERSKILSAAVDTGKVQIVGGVYDLHSGRISPLRTL
jgi:carbonic anhydrase